MSGRPTRQVAKEHYNFNHYIDKRRWASMWHQLDEVLAFEPGTVLEVGPGPGVFRASANCFGPKVFTLDLDPDLKPDYVASADTMPFDDNSFDVVCAFQMLEHVPYEQSLKIFSEMARVARRGVVISLPDAATRWPVAFHIPRVGMKWLYIPKPRFRKPSHRFNGEHYWEINKANYSLGKVISDLKAAAQVELNLNP